MRARPRGQFRGIRSRDTVAVYFIHGAGVASDLSEPLELRLDLYSHSPSGFQWGYLGSGPAQLSLAILARYFRHVGFAGARADREALVVHQAWKVKRVARWSGDSWEITVKEITSDLAAIDAARRKEASDV